MTNEQFLTDVLVPAIVNIDEGPGGVQRPVTSEALRYIAHEILLHIGDPLPEQETTA